MKLIKISFKVPSRYVTCLFPAALLVFRRAFSLSTLILDDGVEDEDLSDRVCEVICSFLTFVLVLAGVRGDLFLELGRLALLVATFPESFVLFTGVELPDLSV